MKSKVSKSKVKKHSEKECPKCYKLDVEFSLGNEPRSMKSRQIIQLVNYLKKISNAQYKFTFQCPHFMEIEN
jgi:hypothetical protein